MSTMNIARHRKTGVFAALMLLLMLFLSACGATVNTNLDLAKDGSGTRLITAKISTDNLSDYVEGGLKAIDASLKKNTPEELKYKGLKENKTDSEAVATFEMSFSSLEDYEAKINALLTASGSELTPEITRVIEDNEFVSGFATKENFGSSDLLGWAENALVADGVVDDENTSSIFSDGEVKVKFDGKSYESSSSYVLVNEVKDYGFDSIELSTVVNDDSTFTQEVTYQINSEKAEKLGDKLKKFLDSATVDGSLEDYYGPSGTTGYRQSFDAADAAELGTKTGQALGSKKVSYEYSFASADFNPMATVGTLTATLDCETVCSPSGEGVDSQVVFPASFESSDTSQGAASSSEDGRLLFEPENTSFSVSAQRILPMDAASVETKIGFDRSLSQTYKFVLSKDTDSMVGEGFARFITPGGDMGTIERNETDSGIEYSLEVSASSAEELESKLANFAAGAAVTATYPEEFQMWPEYFVSQSWEPGYQLGDVPITSGVTASISLPFGHKFSSDFPADGMTIDGANLSASDITGTNINVSASGPTTATFVVIGIIIVVVLALLVVLFIYRKRISKAGKKAWDRRDEAIAAGKKAASGVATASAAAAAGVSAAAGAGLAAANSASAAGTAHATAEQEFSEADLL